MLQAMLRDGSLLTIAKFSRTKIEYFRREYEFYCPVCQEKVFIKAGEKVIPHFAHYHTGTCPSSFGEGPEHEQGKLLLYHWLQQKQIPVVLEKYLRKIEQFPDLLLTVGDKKIALEYQRSSIQKKEINARISGYMRANIVPLWILGENQFNRLSTSKLKITAPLKQFVHKFSYQCKSSLYFFCPHTKQFAFFQDLYFTSNHSAIGTLQFVPLTQATFLKFFRYKPLQKETLYQLWEQEKRKLRLTSNQTSFGRERRWLQWLYLRKAHRETLPSLVYLPVQNELLMKSSPWDWQSRLLLEIIQPLRNGETFMLQKCFSLLRNHLYAKQDFPLYSYQEHPIVQYLRLLEKVQVIKRLSSNKFVKLKSIENNKNIEEAINNDKLLMNTLLTLRKHKSIGKYP